MNLNLIRVDRYEANRQYWLHHQQSKRAGAPAYLRELKRAYWNIRNGHAVLDVFAAIQQAGLDAQQHPKLAIAQAHRKTVIFTKNFRGAGTYQGSDGGWRTTHTVLELPQCTFPQWNSIGERITAPVPIVPASALARCRRADVSELFILWEVESWTPLPPKDPILLRRISKTLFVVIAQWELTPLEQAIIRGRLH